MKREKCFVHLVANGVLIAALLIVALGGVFSAGIRNAGSTQKAIYRGNGAAKRVSLMVNVYEGDAVLGSMLDACKGAGVHLTFFVGGCWAEKHPTLLRRMVAEGHEIGNHGYLHRGAAGLTQKQNEEEIVLCHRLVRTLTGLEMDLFAPPSGELSEGMFQAASRQGYRVVMWSKDTIDWRDKDSDLVLKRATVDTQNGDLILMHPTPHTAEALPKILQVLLADGFKVVPVSENLLPANY